MSTVTVSAGSAWNSCHVQRFGSCPPSIEKVHLSSAVRGVGPADSTGKSRVTYWPGGTRPGASSRRRPRKPREMGLIKGRLRRSEQVDIEPDNQGRDQAGGHHQ